MLPIICIALVLRLGHATGGARVLIWTCWGLRQRLVATWAEFQHSVVYHATAQCRTRLQACIITEGGYSEHLLWHCLPDIPVATYHNRFFSEPPTTTHNWLFSERPTFDRTQETFSHMKKFCNSQVSVVTFSGGLASELQFVFLWDKVNNQKYVWIILLEWLFGISQGKVATSKRWGRQICKISCQIFSGFNMPKIIKIGCFLTESFKKTKGGRFLGHSV